MKADDCADNHTNFRVLVLLKLLRHLAIVGAVSFLVTQAAAGAVGAQTATDPGGATTGSVRLVDQSDWVTGASPFNLQVHVSTNADPTAVDLVVTVYNQIHTRSQFQQSLQDKITGGAVILERHTLSDVLTADGSASISLPVEDPTQKRYYLKDPGIYPVRVDIRSQGTGTVISRFITHLIEEPPPVAPARTLGVATVLPVSSPTSNAAKQAFSAPDAGATFETVSKTLAAHPQTPASVLVAPESIERLGATNSDATNKALSDFRTSVGTRTAIKTTWTDLPAPIYGSDTVGEVGRQLARGNDALSSQFSHVDSSDWIATNQLDTNAVTVLKSQGFSHFVLPESTLASVQRPTTLERPFELSLGKNKTSLTAGAADQGLSDHFADPGGPILGAHRLLADLAVLWNDLPGEQRAVIVMPPTDWNPDPGFLETLFRGLDTSPVLSAQNLDQYFATPLETTGRSPLIRTLNTIAKAQYTTFPANRINDERKRVNGFSDIVESDNKTLLDLERQLLLSETSGLDLKARDTSLDAIKGRVDQQLSLVHMPSERSIRLTARQGEVPISVLNDAGYPVHVSIQLSSSKLAFPNGSARTIEVERQHVTEGFTVDARTSGAFPLDVKLTSPDGQTVIERSTITVKSTATSAIGVGLSIGAGAFLIIWWIRSAFKTHRKRQTAVKS